MSDIVPLAASADPIPAFVGTLPADLRDQMTKAVNAWKLRIPSPHTRRAFARSTAH
jgi:hypothetical protein